MNIYIHTDTTKYFGCELGAQTKFEDDSGLAIVNGAHDGRKLQDMLDGFITRFVLCGKCKNPETVLEITKQQTILKNCKACGAVTNVRGGGSTSSTLTHIRKRERERERERERDDVREYICVCVCRHTYTHFAEDAYITFAPPLRICDCMTTTTGGHASQADNLHREESAAEEEG